jgi:hypothetical protein
MHAWTTSTFTFLLGSHANANLSNMFSESLPTELVADILGTLDLASLIACSQVSRRLRQICTDPQINPWRRPLLRNMSHRGAYEPCLANLSLRCIVPRQNWIEVLTKADAEYLLLEATLPTLANSEWKEVFKRRFLPSWEKWRRETTWRQAYMKWAQLIHGF